MNFAELRFWFLLAAGLGAVLLVRALWVRGRSQDHRDTFDRWALAALGLGLLMAVGWLTFVVYLAVMLVTYVGLRWIQSGGPKRRVWAWPLVAVQLAPLLTFKYGHFLSSELFLHPAWIPAGLAIPVGISFYTFQKVAFVVDTLHRGQPLPGFRDYLNFAGFFPQIVAGPIERREALLPQMEQFRFRWNAADIEAGVPWIVTGLFLKLCLADNIAYYLQPDIGPNAYLVWMNNLLFALRIYFDFAGYSLVALGLARMLGVHLTLNFASPYLAASPSEFWRRWHITLSQWFRDYVYIPLGGNRVPTWTLNILVVFAVSGLWHGAGWNFVAWGVFHGLLLVVAALWWPKGKWGTPVGRALTLGLVLFSWMLFYETRTDVLLRNVHTVFAPAAYSGPALKATLAWAQSPNGTIAIAFVLLSGAALGLEAWSLRRGGEPYSAFRTLPVLAVLILLTVLLAPGVSNGFIYFAF